MKYFIITYGCQMNKSDSERIAFLLKKIGYKKAPSIQEANLVVINMCAVRQSAVDRVYGKIKEINKLKKKKKIKTLLTGCIPKKDLERFKNYFDYILHIKSLPCWKEFLKHKSFLYYPNSRSQTFNRKFDIIYLKQRALYSNNFSTLIPISTGCDNFCSFCIVPFTRGPLSNRDHKEIIKEAENAIKKGSKEIWLLGQNVNAYISPTDPSVNFAELLKKIESIDGDFWIRFTSCNPKDFSEELIDTMANSKKITKYLNLPVQSGDNYILKKMNRPYTISEYKKLVKKIRKKIPDIALSTDIIVGFCQETKKRFQNTVKLFKEVKFDMAYIAQYSPRPGTKAAQIFKDDVPKEEKERREKILTETLKKIALKKNKQYIGKTLKVLIHKAKDGYLIGKTNTYKTVKLKGDKKLVGNFVSVKITKATSWGLAGELSEEKYDKKLIVIVGPTASGKTKLAVDLAKKFEGEIVSADSRQIYKEMNIGTNKPTKKEMGGITHHLIDVVDPDQEFNVALYKEMAMKIIQEIQARNKLPFLVGGTGLYIWAVVDNIEFPRVPPDKKLRKQLEKKTKKELFEIYKNLDPQGAKFIEKENKRRLIRAIEVCKKTKKPFWQQRARKESLFDVLEIGIKLDKKTLKERIEKRVKKMIKKGLEKEAKRLFKKYKNKPSLETIGYQEWKDYFEGKIDKAEVIRRIIQNTNKYAKRQITWFKKDKRIHWITTKKDAEKLIKNFLK